MPNSFAIYSELSSESYLFPPIRREVMSDEKCPARLAAIFVGPPKLKRFRICKTFISSCKISITKVNLHNTKIQQIYVNLQIYYVKMYLFETEESFKLIRWY